MAPAAAVLPLPVASGSSRSTATALADDDDGAPMAVPQDGSAVPLNEAGVPLTDVAPSNAASYGKLGVSKKKLPAHLPPLHCIAGQTAILLAVVWLMPHEAIYDFMFRRVCGESRVWYVQVNNALLQAMYWIVGLTFHWMNRNGKLPQYRLQPVSKTRKFDYMHMVAMTLLSSVLITGLADFDDSARTFLNPVQTGWRLLASLLVIAFIGDAVFYVGHRLTHQYEWLYKTVHAKHHSVYPLIALDALYFHPLDFITHNALPLGVSIGVAQNVFNLHAHTLWLFFFSVQLVGLEDHSGYSFPISPFRYLVPMSTSAHHMRHHSHPSTNFSSYHLDWLGGTNFHQHFEEKGWKGHKSGKEWAEKNGLKQVAPAPATKQGDKNE